MASPNEGMYDECVKFLDRIDFLLYTLKFIRIKNKMNIIEISQNSSKTSLFSHQVENLFGRELSRIAICVLCTYSVQIR